MLRRAAILAIVTATLLGNTTCAAIPETAVTSTPIPTPEPTSTPTATPPQEPTPRPNLAPTSKPVAQGISVTGPSCGGGDFEENRVITKKVAIRANAFLTLTLGSSPSIPCGWQAPEIDDDNVLRQIDHWSEWPAEGVTPMPGAQGSEIWVFQSLEPGSCTVSLACSCLGEKGSGQKVAGTFILQVSIGEETVYLPLARAADIQGGANAQKVCRPD